MQKKGLQYESGEINYQMMETKKQQVRMPHLSMSPFQLTSLGPQPDHHTKTLSQHEYDALV